MSADPLLCAQIRVLRVEWRCRRELNSVSCEASDLQSATLPSRPGTLWSAVLLLPGVGVRDSGRVRGPSPTSLDRPGREGGSYPAPIRPARLTDICAHRRRSG